MGVTAMFVLGFYIPKVVVASVSSLLVGLAPTSGGLSVEIPLAASLAAGGLLAIGCAIGLIRPSHSELAWRKGAAGERRVGRVLDSLARSGVRALHDRKIPGSSANIDHLAVTRSGIFVVDTKSYTGKLEVRGRGSQLWIDGRNRSSLLDQAHRQANIVRGVLADGGPDIPTYPMLCFVGTTLPLLFPPRQIGGVVICTPKSLKQRLLSRPATLLDDQVATVEALLDHGFG